MVPDMAWWKRTTTGPVPIYTPEKRSIPKGVWTKCDECGEVIVEDDFAAGLKVCATCAHHHPLTAEERLKMLIDAESFVPLGENVRPLDPLKFRDSKSYGDRLKSAKKNSTASEAVIVGMAKIHGVSIGIGVMAFDFLGGSMGSVVGERLTLLFERATRDRCVVIICSASGGARMQEGILSLMQMAKIAAALQRHRDAGLAYLSVLHHPTTGGVAASFSMLGDVNLAEPNALIGFAGPRVIEQTIRQKLPEGFQRAEFLVDHGMVDLIVKRAELRDRLAYFVKLFDRTTVH